MVYSIIYHAAKIQNGWNVDVMLFHVEQNRRVAKNTPVNLHNLVWMYQRRNKKTRKLRNYTGFHIRNAWITNQIFNRKKYIHERCDSLRLELRYQSLMNFCVNNRIWEIYSAELEICYQILMWQRFSSVSF